MRKLLAIRGLPGAGKSTLAKMLKTFKHVEADMYFMRSGEYHFNAAELKQAHEWCQKLTETYMLAGHDVVVSNTFTQHWELETYRKLAERYGYVFEQRTVGREAIDNKELRDQFRARCVHNVPEASMERMAARWED